MAIKVIYITVKKFVISIRNSISQSGMRRIRLSVDGKINLSPSAWMFGPAPPGGFLTVQYCYNS
jgi:hypothetical protein